MKTDFLLEHRTIREFTDKKLTKEEIDKLMDIANMTATSNGMQNYSIIEVTDENLKEKLSKVGSQEYMRRSTHLFIFIVDLFRNYKIAEELGVSNKDMIDMDKFFQGFTDASIACQNVVCAAEAMGLGCNYFGNIHNDLKKVIEILKLPKYTLPVVGLGIGYPNQKPQIKPRIPTENKVFKNEYHIYDKYTETLSDYDKKMTEYYDLRDKNRRVDSFFKQVEKKQGSVVKNRDKIFDVIKDQGFIINK
ncbi:MAG: NADPH-dependent oxidoreductase [Tissierellia bacterium]|nr:NADPH-dependent oxidoreductase [Tissierellia bacterium]